MKPADGTTSGAGFDIWTFDGLMRFIFVYRILRLGLSVGKSPEPGTLNPAAPLNPSPRYIQPPCHAG